MSEFESSLVVMLSVLSVALLVGDSSEGVSGSCIELSLTSSTIPVSLFLDRELSVDLIEVDALRTDVEDVRHASVNSVALVRDIVLS